MKIGLFEIYIFHTVNILKFQTLFSFCSHMKCWLLGLVRIANRTNPDETASSDLGPHCLSRPFWLEILEHFPYSVNIYQLFNDLYNESYGLSRIF